MQLHFDRIHISLHNFIRDNRQYRHGANFGDRYLYLVSVSRVLANRLSRGPVDECQIYVYCHPTDDFDTITAVETPIHEIWASDNVEPGHTDESSLPPWPRWFVVRSSVTVAMRQQCIISNTPLRSIHCVASCGWPIRSMAPRDL